MADFWGQNGALVGAGIGLLPMLYRGLFGNNNTPSITSPTSGNNMAQAAQLFPGAQAADLGGYISANPDMFKSGGNPFQAAGMGTAGNTGLLSSLSSLGSALSPAHTTTPGGGTMAQPAPMNLPNYVGTGPNAAMLQSASTMAQSPYGPAALNPFMAGFLRRLGIG